jgi:UDP-N-acetyl-D-galactosamine dehydrogenase
LRAYNVEVLVHDPEADPEQAMHEYGIHLLAWEDLPRADAIVAAVAHRAFLDLETEDLARKLIKGGAFMDVKATFESARLESAGIRVWRL